MLRQAMDAMEERDRNEITSLTPSVSTEPNSSSRGGYGATSETEDESQGHSSDAEDTLDDDSSEDDEPPPPPPTPTFLEMLFGKIKSVILIILNVENLWDTPDTPGVQSRELLRRNHLVVLFWFFILALSYASERCTFKLLVDHAGPFRLMTVEMVTGSHALFLGLFMLIGRFWGHSRQLKSLGIPLVDVGIMALLDTISILLVFLTGYRVTPTLTVILVQFTLPLTAFFTQLVHPDGRCSFFRPPPRTEDQDRRSREEQREPSQTDRLLNAARGSNESSSDYTGFESYPPADSTTNDEEEDPHLALIRMNEQSLLPGYGGLSREHVWGSLIIFLAVLLALAPAFYALADPNMFYYADPIPMRTAINTLLYASSCIPAAAVMLYKEHIFLQYKQPVRMDLLNLLLSVFQFVIASVMSPLLFGLQGLGASGDWTELYPSSAFSGNYEDGLRCFFGRLGEIDQESKYPEQAICDDTMVLVVIHVLSIIFVGVAVDKIVNAGATKVMYRGVSAGIIISVICMHIYDLNEPAFNYGAAIDGLNLVCLIFLILGSEVYHRVTLQESTFETEYPRVDAHYD